MRLDGKPFKGGPEWYVFTEIWKHGGKYIIIAKNTNQNTGRVENHAFVHNADYVGSDGNFRGSIVNNQKHTQMYAIEADDLSTVRKCRMICYRLFGGTTILTYCDRVFTKAERENSNNVYQKKKNTSIKKRKRDRKE